MSFILLHNEWADEKVFKELRVFFMVKFRDTHFVLEKRTNPQNKRFGAQETCSEMCGTVDV